MRASPARPRPSSTAAVHLTAEIKSGDAAGNSSVASSASPRPTRVAIAPNSVPSPVKPDRVDDEHEPERQHDRPQVEVEEQRRQSDQRPRAAAPSMTRFAASLPANSAPRSTGARNSAVSVSRAPLELQRARETDDRGEREHGPDHAGDDALDADLAGCGEAEGEAEDARGRSARTRTRPRGSRTCATPGAGPWPRRSTPRAAKPGALTRRLVATGRRTRARDTCPRTSADRCRASGPRRRSVPARAAGSDRTARAPGVGRGSSRRASGRPGAARRACGTARAAPCGSSPVNGSSRNTIAGSWTSARASETRCCMPRENVPTGSSARLARPTVSSSAATRARGSATPYSRAKNSRFSRAVRSS